MVGDSGIEPETSSGPGERAALTGASPPGVRPPTTPWVRVVLLGARGDVSDRFDAAVRMLNRCRGQCQPLSSVVVVHGRVMTAFAEIASASYAGLGMAPSCWKRPNAFITTHCSAILSLARRKTFIDSNATSRPVAGTPKNAPRCEPHRERRTATRSFEQ